MSKFIQGAPADGPMLSFRMVKIRHALVLCAALAMSIPASARKPRLPKFVDTTDEYTGDRTIALLEVKTPTCSDPHNENPDPVDTAFGYLRTKDGSESYWMAPKIFVPMEDVSIYPAGTTVDTLIDKEARRFSAPADGVTVRVQNAFSRMPFWDAKITFSVDRKFLNDLVSQGNLKFRVNGPKGFERCIRPEDLAPIADLLHRIDDSKR